MAKQHHDSKVLEFARKLGSRQAGFIFAVIGVLSQWVHVFYITYHLSSLDGFTKFVQAGTMSLFFNAALLYFILKRGSVEDEEVANRYKRLIFWFAALEIFMNLYYWGNKFIIEPWPEADWSKLIIAIPMAIILPITLAAYSFEIRVDDFSENDEPDLEKDSQQIDPLVEEKILHEIATKLQHGDRVDFEFEYMQNGQLKTKLLRNVKLLPPTNENIAENTEVDSKEISQSDGITKANDETGTSSSNEKFKVEDQSEEFEYKPIPEESGDTKPEESGEIPESKEESVNDNVRKTETVGSVDINKLNYPTNTDSEHLFDYIKEDK